MSTISASDFAAEMVRLARRSGKFKPSATYDPDGDCIEFIAKPDPFYGERIDDLVTVYYSQETHEIVDSLVKGIEGIIRKYPGLKIELVDGKVRLVHLFRAHLWSRDFTLRQKSASVTYLKLLDVVEQSEVTAQVSAR